MDHIKDPGQKNRAQSLLTFTERCEEEFRAEKIARGDRSHVCCCIKTQTPLKQVPRFEECDQILKRLQNASIMRLRNSSFKDISAELQNLARFDELVAILKEVEAPFGSC